MHIGKRIKDELHRQGRSIVWFSENLCCTRSNVYKIFDRASVDTILLRRISVLLEHDFFNDLSDNLSEDLKK